MLSNLVTEFPSKNNKQVKITLGISKLCCKLCASGVSAIQAVYNKHAIAIRGRHGNFYYAWKPSTLLMETCFKEFVGKNAFQTYSQAGPVARGRIIEALKDLSSYRISLTSFFQSQRGAVRLDSISSAPSSSTASDSIASSLLSEEYLDSSSDEEKVIIQPTKKGKKYRIIKV